MPSYRLHEITANGQVLQFDSATLNVHPDDNQWWIQVRTKEPIPRDIEHAEAYLDITTSDARRFVGKALPVPPPEELLALPGSQLLLVLHGLGTLQPCNL